MTGLHIGRLTDDTGLETVDSVDYQGDELSIGGTLLGKDAAHLADLVQQVAGMADNSDERVIPVYWDDDHRYVDGYYRVASASAGIPRSGDLSHGPFDLSLTRVSGYAAPLLESTILGSGRLVPSAAAGAAAAPSPWMALPATVRGFELGVDQTPRYADRASEGGPVTVFRSSELWNANVQFFVPPQEWYVGAATLSVAGAVVVGKQARNAPSEWSISNGLVRVSATSAGFLVEGWTDGQWGLPLAVRTIRRSVDLSTETFVSAPHTITILRNAPEEVIVRLTMDAASATPGARFSVTTDLSLRRGARTVSIRTVARGNYNWGLDIEGFPTGAWSSYDDGVARGAYVLGRDRYSSISGQEGGVVRVRTLGSRGFNNPFVAALGYCTPGVTVGHVDFAQDVINQWTAVQSEWVDAVRR